MQDPDNLSAETLAAIKEGLEQSLNGNVTEMDFSAYADELDPE